jgi:hypothetical protein
MGNGSTKAIEDVKEGEYVLASDPETGELQARKVTDTITGDGLKHLITLTVDPDGTKGDAKPATITATDEHPFWLPDFGKWVNAEDLEPGMRLQTSTGAWAQITAIDESQRTQRVHNLTVEGQHTYFVLAGDTTVLVHNDDKELCRLLGISQQQLNQLVGDAYRDHVADSFRQRGLNVITDATHPDRLTFPTPWGDRKYDIGLLDGSGNVSHYIETKSGNAGKKPIQALKDRYLEKRFGIVINYVFDD